MRPPELLIYPDAQAGATAFATELRLRVAADPELTLGLPTGGTPRALYAEMVRLHREEGADWSRVRGFNLDEYWPMAADDPQSFARFMRERLIEPAGFDPGRMRIPSGEVAEDAVAAHCAAYEEEIAAAGGVALQILGIGVNGHLGFNEPGAAWDGRTHLAALAPSTRARAQAAFAGREVPHRGITMGLGTILDAGSVVVMAFGADKAEAVARALAEPSPACPASCLLQHPRVTWLLDRAAAAELPDAHA